MGGVGQVGGGAEARFLAEWLSITGAWLKGCHDCREGQVVGGVWFTHYY